VSGGLFDPDIVAATAAQNAAYICGHLRGRTLADVFAAEAPASWIEVADELAQRLAAVPAGLRARTLIDPGLGFGKGSDPSGNSALIRHAGDLAARLDRPVVLGASRKRFLSRLLGSSTDTRRLDAATLGASLAGAAAGAHVLRVHDPGLLRAALVVYFEIRAT